MRASGSLRFGSPAKRMTRSCSVKAASTPEKIVVRKIERNAGNLMTLKTISSTSGSRQTREMLNASPSVARAASMFAADAVTSAVRLMTRKISRAMRMAGPVVANMVRMCCWTRDSTDQTRHQDGRFGERRHLVAEVGAGDHRAGRDLRRETHHLRHPHERDAERAGGRPGAAGDRAGDGADRRRPGDRTSSD